MSAPPSEDYLGTEAVMRRYGLRDPRCARRLMDDAGAIVVGHRLLVRPDDLERHEEALRAQRRAQANGSNRRPSRRVRSRRAPAQDLSNLPPDWLDEMTP